MDECKLKCNEDKNCKGFDFDNNKNQCYSHNVTTLPNKHKVSGGVDQYIQVPCTVTPVTPGEFAEMFGVNYATMIILRDATIILNLSISK